MEWSRSSVGMPVFIASIPLSSKESRTSLYDSPFSHSNCPTDGYDVLLLRTLCCFIDDRLRGSLNDDDDEARLNWLESLCMGRSTSEEHMKLHSLSVTTGIIGNGSIDIDSESERKCVRRVSGM